MSVDPAYRDEYALAEAGHWWFVSRRRILQSLLEGMPAPARILVLGSGPGEEARWLGRFGPVVALDREGRADVRGDAQRLPVRDRSADWVCAFDVLEHLEDDGEALSEMRRSCRPGGRVLVTVPAHPWLWSDHDRVNRHLRRYRSRDLKVLAEASGCRLLRLTHFHAPLLIPALPLRALQRLLPRRKAPVSDLRRGRWLPSWTAGALAAERHVLARTDLPFGLSLFAALEPA